MPVIRLRPVPAATTAEERRMRGASSLDTEVTRWSRSAGIPGRDVGRFEPLAERLHLHRDVGQVVADRRELRVARGGDGQLDGPGHRLVEAGVEESEAVTGLGDRLVHPRCRGELRPDRRFGPGGQVVGVARGLDLGQLPLRRGDVDALAGIGERMAGLGDLPALRHPLVDLLVERREPVAQRPGTGTPDGTPELRLRRQRVLHQATPGLGEAEGIDPLLPAASGHREADPAGEEDEPAHHRRPDATRRHDAERDPDARRQDRRR